MKKTVTICMGRSCVLFGAERIIEEVYKFTGLRPGEENEEYKIETSACFADCSTAPNIKIDDELLSNIRPEHISHILNGQGCACAMDHKEEKESSGPVTADDIIAANDFLGDLN